MSAGPRSRTPIVDAGFCKSIVATMDQQRKRPTTTDGSDYCCLPVVTKATAAAAGSRPQTNGLLANWKTWESSAVLGDAWPGFGVYGCRTTGRAANMRDSVSSDTDSGIFPSCSSSGGSVDAHCSPKDDPQQSQDAIRSVDFRPRLYSKRGSATAMAPRNQTKLQRTHSSVLSGRRSIDVAYCRPAAQPPSYQETVKRIGQMRVGAIDDEEDRKSAIVDYCNFQSEQPNNRRQPRLGRRSLSMNCIYDTMPKVASGSSSPTMDGQQSVSARLMAIGSDQSRVVELQKPSIRHQFGFVVTLANCGGKKGMYVEEVFEKGLQTVLSRGDQIVEFNGTAIVVRKNLRQFFEALQSSCLVKLKTVGCRIAQP